MKTKLFVFFSACLLMLGCKEVYFAKKVTGQIPYELEGEYYVEIEDEDGIIESALATIKRLEKSIFLIQDAIGDTAYYGEIVRKKGDYYMNQASEEYPGYWAVSSFRIVGDSAYNLVEALGIVDPMSWEAIEAGYFDDHQVIDLEESTVYLVDNRRRETLKAFRYLNDLAIKQGNGMLMKKLNSTEQQDSGLFSQSSPESQAFPNPFIEKLHIELPADLNFAPKEKVQLILLDLQGKELNRTEFTGSSHEWDLSQVAAGNYLLKIQRGQQLWVKQLVKE